MAFMKKMKDGFNKLVGTPMDAQAAVLNRKCEECTSANLLETDWQLHRQLCLMMGEGDVGANSETVLACLDKRLQSMNPRVQMHALTVCESCVEHCGPAFHEQLAVGPFFKRIRQAVMEPDNPRRDAQVFQKMIVLVEDWARALPYTVFTQALQTALAAGVQLPYRNEADKAPKYDLQAYDQMRIQQADTVSLRQRYAMSQQSQGQCDSLGQTPLGPIPGSRRQRHMEGAQMHSGVDEAVLAALSDADRAAVLAAMSGAEQADATPSGTPEEASAPGAEELPKFDCQGSTDQLQVDLSVAAENATLLKDLVATVEAPADVSSDPVVGSLLQRCRVLQGGVQRVIQKIQDESVMAAALQVYEQLNAAVEQYNGMAAPERKDSELMSGTVGQEGAPAGAASAPQHASDPSAYAPAAPAADAAPAFPASDAAPAFPASDAAPAFPAASASQHATLAAAQAAPSQDLIDFGDDDAEAPPAATSVGAPAGAAGDASSPAAVPNANAQDAIYDDFDSLVGTTDASAQGTPAGTLEGAMEGISLQQPQATSASENPFAT